MKNIISSILVLAVLFTCFASPTKVEAAEAVQTKSTIDVSGEGKIKVKPDMADVTLGVTTSAKDAKTAQKENAVKMDAVVKAIKAVGIAETDIQTSNYNIYPQYDWDYINPVTKEKERKLTGYEVSNNVNITIRDIKLVSNVIDIAAEKGINNANGIRFSVSKTEELYLNALQNAVKNAEAKAVKIASIYNVKLQKPLTITENSTGGYRTTYMNNYVMAKAEAADAATPIEAGEIEITASVNIKYEF